MRAEKAECEISAGDLRAALMEMKGYVDITEEDLMQIYRIALRHAKERLAAKVPVRDVMTTEVVTVKGDADMHEVAALLSSHRISGLPVVEEENLVIGMITEADVLSMAGITHGHTFKDLLRHLLGEPLPKHKPERLVKDAMTSPVIMASPDMDIKEVASILDEKRIKRLPVVDDQGKLVGIISRSDIVRTIRKTKN